MIPTFASSYQDGRGLESKDSQFGSYRMLTHFLLKITEKFQINSHSTLYNILKISRVKINVLKSILKNAKLALRWGVLAYSDSFPVRYSKSISYTNLLLFVIYLNDNSLSSLWILTYFSNNI